MKPYALSGSKLIGDRWMFSMELSQDADRKTLSVGRGKTLTYLTGTFTMNGTVTKDDGVINGRQTYWLKNPTSTLSLKTPSDWMFTSQEKIEITAEIYNSVGTIYHRDNTLVTEGKAILPGTVTLGAANATVNVTDLLSTIGNYKFDVWSGSSFVLRVNIIASADNGETKTVIANYNFTKALP